MRDIGEQDLYASPTGAERVVPGKQQAALAEAPLVRAVVLSRSGQGKSTLTQMTPVPGPISLDRCRGRMPGSTNYSASRRCRCDCWSITLRLEKSMRKSNAYCLEKRWHQLLHSPQRAHPNRWRAT